MTGLEQSVIDSIQQDISLGRFCLPTKVISFSYCPDKSIWNLDNSIPPLYTNGISRRTVIQDFVIPGQDLGHWNWD